MKALFLMPAADWSTADVARGYANAFERAGHEVYRWAFNRRLSFVVRALDLEDSPENLVKASGYASKMLVEDIVEQEPDIIILVSGIVFHPLGLALARKLDIPIVGILTESPYNEEQEQYLAQFFDLTTTNDRGTAQRNDWLYLPPSYDALVHVPGPSEDVKHHDVVFAGTAWSQRAERFSQIDWTGIDFGLYGLWPRPDGPVLINQELINADEYSQLTPYIQGGPTTPAQTLNLYRGAKLCINDHRPHPLGESLGPRVYEVLAVGGGLLLTDYRPEIEELLGPLWPDFVYKDAKDLDSKIHYYLRNDEARQYLVEYGKQRVSGQTFDARVQILLEQMKRRGWLAEDARVQTQGDSTWQPSISETQPSILAPGAQQSPWLNRRKLVSTLV